MARVPRARVILLTVGLLVLAIVVATSSLRQDGDAATDERRGGEPTAGSDRLRGPDVPPEGALPGRLWVVVPNAGPSGARCQMRAIDLGALELEPPGELQHCTLVDVADDGSYAVASDDALRLALFDLQDRPEKALDLDPAFRERSPRSTRVASISADGKRVAWCTAGNESAVLEIDDATVQRAVGCDPRFGPDGELFTRTLPPLADGVLTEGQVVLAGNEFRQGLDLADGGPSSLLAYDVGTDGLIATKVRRVFGQPQPTVQLWSDGTLESFHRVSGLLPTLQASGVELSPDATRIAFGWPGLLAGVLDFGFQRMSRTFENSPYAWSPDGRWLAVGETSAVVIYARGSDAPTYRLPVATLMIAWSE